MLRLSYVHLERELSMSNTKQMMILMQMKPSRYPQTKIEQPDVMIDDLKLSQDRPDAEKMQDCKPKRPSLADALSMSLTRNDRLDKKPY